jgi:hypothetical protein
MILQKKIAIAPLKIGDSTKRMLERFHIQNNFEIYLKSIGHPDKNSLGIKPNYQHHLMSQVMNYIDGLFTLPQLYCIFNASLRFFNSWGYGYTSLDEFKPFLISFINEEDEYENDLDDIVIFKKNVLELNSIIFTVLNDLLYEAGLWDADYCEGYKYPEISDDEKECSIDFQELIRTYNALEKIGTVCEKVYHIDDRVAALTKEGYEIKPCWVGSGGVKSTFYMYKKKEIRIQIAASKFKGNGNSKSKSALCAIIPYPKFLHKNCVKLWY